MNKSSNIPVTKEQILKEIKELEILLQQKSNLLEKFKINKRIKLLRLELFRSDPTVTKIYFNNKL